ncbi:MAG: transcription-repair coupling factor [Chitinophagaceae bacterium]|nr:transcription-repair coupling factor [Chitinophagaceae bacterium]MCA6481279.1 transcription-repair coupling factor [Chitinophagaceae bacterium]MCA6492467.1 transcription-repair coupling factor [Chitinophagaceae bacterium]MCA6513213.1 transcription-repair coupling factor [Chitinophagaceae bacterium]
MPADQEVSNINLLLEKYHQSPLVFQLGDRLLYADPQNMALLQLQGSSPEFLLAALMTTEKTAGLNHLVVLNDAEEAAYFHNTLENITQALDIFYFPSSFKTPKNFRQVNNSHVMLRTEALTKMASGGNKKIVITYPEALVEKVVVSEQLNSRLIAIKTNDTIQPEELMERLVSYGFHRTDFVYEPGQFALRGGILDIYSFGNEKPYRIELFGNEVDSIRLFDPQSQLSERKLLQVNIIPHVETQFSSENKIPLPLFMPEETIVWLKDRSFILSKMEEQLAAFQHHQQQPTADTHPNWEEEEVKQLPTLDEKDFYTGNEWEHLLQLRHVVELGTPSEKATLELDAGTRPQPSFNRRFDWLISDWKEKEAAGYQIFLFAEQVKQLERLSQIFSDLSTSIDFIPVNTAIHEGFINDQLKVVCYTDHQIFQRYHKYRVKQAFNKNKALTIKTLRDLQPGDFVSHIDHGVGVFSGLQKIEVNGRWQEAVRLIYKDSDILYVNINSLHKISKFSGKDGTLPKVNKLGSDAWQKLKEKTKTKVKELAFDLIKLYARRKALQGHAHSPDNYLQHELEASFLYEDTPDQSKATADVKKDMESESPMDRLVCGDVGFGKTEVAIRAAFKTCVDGKQAAVLVPTTILAFQHYKTFQERLRDFPVTVDFINRFKSAKEKKETLKKLAEGKIDIIIGTHGILGKEVVFKNLGLLVIDEEQKFGVAHKEKLKTLRANVDCLTLTATPIPRTLQFSLMGARDLSIINTPPPNRQPIQTEVHVFNDDYIRDAIYFETERGGQVFFIHNRIQGLAEMANLIQSLCPDLSVGYAHGQLEGHELEERILDFIERRYDVLICTNIVESGVDIPNVNTIIVNNAHQFGLSDLHQLRGRVGRSNKKAFCYLLAPMATLAPDSRKRLQILEQFSDLGSGFQIAMRDLDIRGAGNMLGGEQSGFIAEIGLEMYQKILEEAVRELKRSDFADMFKEEITRQDEYVSDCTIDTDREILIPDDYVESITERLSLYTRLDNCETADEIELLQQELTDRFGPLPEPVKELMLTIQSRWLAVDIGFEKMTLKDTTLRCYFINRPDSPYFESALFKGVLQFLQEGTNKARLRQTGRMILMVVDQMEHMQDVLDFLHSMHQFLQLDKKQLSGGAKK